MGMLYIRLQPFDVAKGALCRRFTVGGMLFEEGRWYQLAAEHVKMLRPLKQGTGTPYMQIAETEEEWREINRRELAMAMAGPAGAALADMFQPKTVAPSAQPKHEGEKIASSFGKIAAKEVDHVTAARAAAQDLVPAMQNIVMSAGVSPQVSPSFNLESMTREELISMADSKNIEFDHRMKKTGLIELLKGVA